jgi:hypothetical protein
MQSVISRQRLLERVDLGYGCGVVRWQRCESERLALVVGIAVRLKDDHALYGLERSITRITPRAAVGVTSLRFTWGNYSPRPRRSTALQPAVRYRWSKSSL